MRGCIGVVLALGLLGGCRNGERDVGDGRLGREDTIVTQDKTSANHDELATRLATGAYGDLWNYLTRDGIVRRIWAEPDGPEALVAIAKDPARDMQARFIAAEVIFSKNVALTHAVGEATLAEIFADALVNNRTGSANAWGLLWEHRDAGPVGVRFEMLGKAALPALAKLMTNATPGPRYRGSEEATVGNGYHFRIKDFAAYYVGEIQNAQLTWTADPAARDAAIAQLLASLSPR